MNKFFLLFLIALSSAFASDRYHPSHPPGRPDKPGLRSQRDIDDDEDASYWQETGMDNLEDSIEITTNTGPAHAKNIIIFVGDGMSENTVTAARIYKAQMEGNFDDPETQTLAMDQLAFSGLSKTYSVNAQVPDSASTATAIFSGVKTNSGVLGFDANIAGPETMSPDIEVSTILTWAQEAGMDTGIVSTARITHATPAATYSHVWSRGWECDADYNEEDPPPAGYTDIASQLINNEPGTNLKVILGGGYPAFFPKEMASEIKDNYGFRLPWDCFRQDGQNLAQQWLDDKAAMGVQAQMVMNKTELDEVNVKETDYLFGLFSANHMPFDYWRGERDPSIVELTEKAVQMLQKNDNGFFLMVEGGRIDHAHHATEARTALSETVAMDNAVSKAMEILGDDLENTLIIVTADHSHTITISGYAARGTLIDGLSTDNLDDDLPHTILNYANGPGFYIENLPPSDNAEDPTHVERRDLSSGHALLTDVESYAFLFPSAGPDSSESHGGDDVLIHANGPGAQLFHHTHEQTHIANVMAYSACVGRYKNFDQDDEICQLRNV